MVIRQPIAVVVGHVDHGKSRILDTIRKTVIVEKEAGAITQAIGASIVPIETIKKICGKMLETLKLKLTLPGILFIDTPGHAAFANLRRRGGNLADIAILVVDVNEGFKPQTFEAVDILKRYKTPFIVAANKIDLIAGWVKDPEKSILENIRIQADNVQNELDKRIYELVGTLSELGFESERFDRVSDYTKQVAIVPTDAKFGEGIAELLMVLTGLAQRFLEQSLKVDVEGPAKGTILEVKEERGLGKTMDVIIYDGRIKTGDTIVIGNIDGPIVAKVRALFEPAPLAEMRDEKAKFKSVKEAVAATGVKISAPGAENVIAGMPLRVAPDKESVDTIKEELEKEVEEVLIETDKEGIIIKADTLGSLEALVNLLREKKIPIRKAIIGDVNKKDIIDAESNLEKQPMYAIVLGFNVQIGRDVKLHDTEVTVLTNDVIYRLIEDYEKWQEHRKKQLEARELQSVTRPCKIEILKGYVFRQSNPAIVGVEVLLGTLKTGMNLMTEEGECVTVVKGLQQEKQNISEAQKGKQVAASLTGVTIGRQIKEGDVLYSFIEEGDFRMMKKHKEYLTADEKDVLRQIAEIMRRKNPVWGV
ncbi:translation initiation factor IF-2 [Candidatus Woesearchaeota archaeon]|nr:MAG: translation initiation factor IF-2 [Candidatus Woesearchaeota archaeon]